jgi:membrane protein implicated in regulation of membrane protease activity
LLSLFLGIFGADLFYMGFPIIGAAKLCTLGGFGVWWVIDVIRVGSAPVYAHDYRLAADLPHWAFVITVVMFTFTLGFLLVGCSTFRHIRSKRKEALLLQAEEALHGFDLPAPQGLPKNGMMRSFAPQYGSV